MSSPQSTNNAQASSKNPAADTKKTDGVPMSTSQLAQADFSSQQNDGTVETQPPVTKDMVSEAAKAEGGAKKGSHAAQLQSQLSKQQNDAKDDSERPNGTPQTMSELKTKDVVTNGTDDPPSNNSNESASRDPKAPIQERVRALEMDLPVRIGHASGNNSTESALATSEHTKFENFHQAAHEIITKMNNDPSHVTMKDAAYLESRESRALGGIRPPKESVAAEAKRMASANVRAAASAIGNSDGNTARVEPTPDKTTNAVANTSGKADNGLEAEFYDAEQSLSHKIETDPSSITSDDANHLHSLERRARGNGEKGGVAATAQSIVAKNQMAI